MKTIVIGLLLISTLILGIGFSSINNFYWVRSSEGGTALSVYTPPEQGVCVFQGLGNPDILFSGLWEYREDRGGFSSSSGRLFFPAPYAEYAIKATMQFDPVGPDSGSYGVFFDTRVTDDNKDYGFMIRLDRNSRELLIKRRSDGTDTGGTQWMLQRINLTSKFPDSWWTQEHELELVVTRVPGSLTLKQLSVRIDDQWLIAGYRFDDLIQPTSNYTGFLSGGSDILFMCMIQDEKDTGNEYIPGDERSVLAWYHQSSGRIDNQPPLAKESKDPVYYQAGSDNRIYYPGGAKEGITWKAPAMIFLSSLDLSLPLVLNSGLIQFSTRLDMNTSGGNTGAAILRPYLPWQDALIIFAEVRINNRVVSELSHKSFRFNQEIDLSKPTDWAKLIPVASN